MPGKVFLLLHWIQSLRRFLPRLVLLPVAVGGGALGCGRTSGCVITVDVRPNMDSAIVSETPALLAASSVVIVLSKKTRCTLTEIICI